MTDCEKAIEVVKARIIYHADETKYRYEIGKGVLDICAEDIVKDLEALRSQAERSRGCPWCKAEYTIIDDDFGQPVHPNMIKFCWHCGRALKGGE